MKPLRKVAAGQIGWCGVPAGGMGAVSAVRRTAAVPEMAGETSTLPTVAARGGGFGVLGWEEHRQALLVSGTRGRGDGGQGFGLLVRGAVLLVVMVLMCAGGCYREVRQSPHDLWRVDVEAEDGGESLSDLPNFGELRKHRKPRQYFEETTQHQHFVHAGSLRVMFGVDGDVRQAMALTDTSLFDTPTLELWRANGMTLGTLPAGKLDAFLKKLPRALGSETITAHYLVNDDIDGSAPVLRNRRHSDVVAMRYVSPGAGGDAGEGEDLVTSREQFHAGRFQILSQYYPSRGGELVITPHHHRPKVTLMLRPEHVRALDGRLFQELSFTYPCDADRLLVIAPYHRVMPAGIELEFPPDPEEAGETEGEDVGDGEAPARERGAGGSELSVDGVGRSVGAGKSGAEALPRILPLPEDSLGHIMLGTRMRDRSMHSVVIIRCPLPG